MSKVLIVDDSSTLRRIVREALSILEFDTQEADNGHKALECLEESDFDLIILDWIMPEMDGFELFNKMQGMEKFKAIPVIMLTAENNNDMVLKAIRSGVKHYLTKPFTREELLARVLKVLNLDQNAQ